MAALTDVRSSVRAAALSPSSRAIGGATAVARGLGSLFCALGLFTVSWERLGNIPVSGYNVKPAVLCFLLAAAFSVPGGLDWLRRLRAYPPAVRWVVVLAALSVVVVAIRAVTAAPIALGAAQLAAVLTGAVLPALAVLGVVLRRSDVVWALRWFVAGAVVAGLFGLYQLAAFYLGLPQGVAYTGVGTSGAGGRISAFSYEPAYFASFLVLAAGAVIALAWLIGTRVSWPVIVFFGLVMTLVNVRALLFVLPVAGALLAVAWRRNRVLLLKAVVTGVVLAAATAAVATVSAAVVASPPPAGTNSTVPPHTASPSEEPEPEGPQLPTDVLDPHEASSNGPRLDLYKAVLTVDLEHGAVGVGPGHLREALAKNGYVAPNQTGNVVANNIWLQAVADGGVALLLLEGASIAAVVVLWWRARRSPSQPLASTWLAVVLVSGLLTSYYFDIKLWVVMAVVLVIEVDRARHPDASAAE